MLEVLSRLKCTSRKYLFLLFCFFESHYITKYERVAFKRQIPKTMFHFRIFPVYWKKNKTFIYRCYRIKRIVCLMMMIMVWLTNLLCYSSFQPITRYHNAIVWGRRNRRYNNKFQNYQRNQARSKSDQRPYTLNDDLINDDFVTTDKNKNPNRGMRPSFHNDNNNFNLHFSSNIKIFIEKVQILLSQIKNKKDHSLPSQDHHQFVDDVDRRTMLRRLVFGICGINTISLINNNKNINEVVYAFEGGVGGLGKTKPDMGVTYWNDDIKPFYNNNQIVSAELKIQEKPVLVSFYSPWPLLSTTSSNSLETRDPLYPESGFIQVIDNSNNNIIKFKLLSQMTKSDIYDLLLNTVFSQQGKFGAYAAPIDVKVKLWNDNDYNNIRNSDTRNEMNTNHLICTVTFTTFTPGLRESDRQIYIHFVQPFKNNTLILLVTGTTRQRFIIQKEVFTKIITSFEVIPAPINTKTT